MLRSKGAERNLFVDQENLEQKTKNELLSQIQSLEDIIKNVTNERKSVELLVSKFSSFFSKKEMTILLRDILIINEQVFQIQRDKIKLTQRLRELDYERKINEYDKNVQIEMDNIRNLLEEYEIRLNNKKEELKNLDNDLNKLDTCKNKYQGEQTNSSTFQRKYDTNENVLKLNYQEKHSSSNFNKSEFNKFDRKAKTKENEFFNKEKLLDNTDHNSKAFERSEHIPTTDNKFRRVKCNILHLN